jgi:hypothetical protein
MKKKIVTLPQLERATLCVTKELDDLGYYDDAVAQVDVVACSVRRLLNAKCFFKRN